ncbi:MAG: hypothetical protein KME21_20080 [Desmonostoc vinosum HA7617-LM4]|nr:hypothetical protein [Desmonostoc vinosum HA7617-LM4]
MMDRINDIAWQAHQGSVAAIIQLLNEKLANSGVRIRAIFANGVLQLLCEAAKVEQLEQSALVQQIQQIMDAIAPRNIRRVNINSRIVREQQLLWLEEINRDRENQLLWSEEIALATPSIVKQIIKDFSEARIELKKPNLPKTKSSLSLVINNKNKPRNGKIVAVTGFCLLLLLGWFVYAQLGSRVNNLIQPKVDKSSNTPNSAKTKTSLHTAEESLDISSNDPFVAAVRVANQASASGKTAITSTQWLELAAMWQRASDLMSTVPSSHNRHQEAKIRTQLYKKYSEAAQQEAKKSKS